MVLKPPIPPMEARSVEEIPTGDGWQYEPKWDGFRCLAFRNGDKIFLQSKNGQPLARYFPDVAEAVARLPAKYLVLDGELVVRIRSALSFDELQLRLHPAASRVAKLAKAHPAIYIVFDLLAESERLYLKQPLRKRRERLAKFARSNFKLATNLRLSPATTDLSLANKWFKRTGGDLDGIIAKRLDAAYATGERIIGSLLLGLYADDGLLHHVGFTSAFTREQRRELTKKFEALRKSPGFTGNAPGGPSRWSTERTGEWEPVDPKVVVEVAYDHFTGGRFRHGTRLRRWRPDKDPRQCTMDQVEHREGKSLALLNC